MTEEERHLNEVASIGCIVCLLFEGVKTPPEIHHCRFPAGTGQKATFRETIGLCTLHHRTGGYGVAFHAGPRAFEKKFGTEQALLSKVLELINREVPCENF